MARRPVSIAQASFLNFDTTLRVQTEIVESLPASAGARKVTFDSDKPKRPKTYRPADPRAFELAKRDAEKRVEQRGRDDVWDGTDESVILGLYAALHHHVYKVEATDLMDEWKNARVHVKRFWEKEFGRSIPQIIAFVRWKWGREAQQFPNRESDFRLSWRYFFSSRVAADYRVGIQRRMRESR